jgi:hypothetical protein
MMLRVYQSTEAVTRSIVLVRHVADVEVSRFPDDPDDFAAEYDGDFLEVAPGDDHE